MSALLVEGGGLVKQAACPSILARIRSIEANARARDLRRLERLEARSIDLRLNEDLRLCAMAAGEACGLSCQKDNISRSFNHTYYNRCAVALQTNISRWVLSVGKKYAKKEVREMCDSVGYTPDLIKELERVAKLHVAEFTITMRSEKGADLLTERRRFSRAWNAFNKRYLKEIAADYFGEFVRVFETHKSGALHAHVLIECKKPLCRFDEYGKPLPFKWRPSGAVNGSTVADWCLYVWQTIRTGQLDYLGIGERHTLQPIRKGVNLFARYISKYISKDIVNRKPHLRGLRMVAYSQGFLSGCRVMAYDYDKSELIPYWSKKFQCQKFRYKRFTSFDIEGASTCVRRLKLRRLCRWLNVSKRKLKFRLGAKWAFYTRSLVSKIPLSGNVYGNLNKWERFAALRNMAGDKSHCVFRFDEGGAIYDYPEFMAFDAETRQKAGWRVFGFVESGAFVSVKKKMAYILDEIKNDFENVFEKVNETKGGLKTKIDGFRNLIHAAWKDWQGGKIACEKWLSIARGCVAKIKEMEEFCDYFIAPIERKRKSENLEIPKTEQMKFAI